MEFVLPLTAEDYESFPLRMAWWKGFRARKSGARCPYTQNIEYQDAWDHGSDWALTKDLFEFYCKGKRT